MARDVLEVVSGQDRGARFEMNGASLVVGREADLDVVLTDPRVSRRHARLWLEGDDLMVEDLASTHGTLLNGEPLRKDTALRPGDVVTVGETELRVLWTPTGAPITDEVPVIAPGSDATARLVVPGEAVPPLTPAPAAVVPRPSVLATVAGGLGVLAGIQVLWALGPSFAGQGIAASGTADLIAQTVLIGLVLLGTGAAAILVGVGVVGVPAWSTRVLADALLLLGGLALGQGIMGASVAGQAAGAASALFIDAGLVAIAGGVLLVLVERRGRSPEGLSRLPALLLGGVPALGALLVVIGSPLEWFDLGFDTTPSGFALGIGKALLALGVVTLLYAVAVQLLALGRRSTLAAALGRAVLPLAAVLFAIALTTITVATTSALRVGLILALVGSIIAVGSAIAAEVLLTLDDARYFEGRTPPSTASTTRSSQSSG